MVHRRRLHRVDRWLLLWLNSILSNASHGVGTDVITSTNIHLVHLLHQVSRGRLRNRLVGHGVQGLALVSFRDARAWASDIDWNVVAILEGLDCEVVDFSLGHGSFLEGFELLGRDFDSLDGNALRNAIKSANDIILEDQLQLVELTGKDAWLHAFEFTNVSSDDLSGIDDVVVLATLIIQKEIVIVLHVRWAVVSTDHHLESDVVGIVLVIVEVVKLDLGVLQPVIRFLELSVINLLQVFEFLLDVDQILLKNGLGRLFLNYEDVAHFLEAFLKLSPELLRLLSEIKTK